MTLEELAKEPRTEQREDPCQCHRRDLAKTRMNVVEHGGGGTHQIVLQDEATGYLQYKILHPDWHLGGLGGE